MGQRPSLAACLTIMGHMASGVIAIYMGFDDLRLVVLQSQVAGGLDDPDVPPDIPDGAPSEGG